ncbi:MAG: hypothetical protein JJ899_17590 [Alphaproteobacteria bacterium]|nr:hypothetical protein [Alphaproteobacteria bacterium]
MAKYLVFRFPERVVLQHSFFSKFPDALFLRDEESGVPVLMFELGEQKVRLPFEGFKREFGLAEWAADAVMLNTIAISLNYVTALKIGDDVPMEVLTGNPSWTPDALQIAEARKRVTAELVGWNLEQEVPRDDPAQLRQFGERYVNGETIRFALLRLSAHLGYRADGASQLSKTMNDLCEEFSYIEALRERAAGVAGISRKVAAMKGAFSHHAGIMADLHPVSQMIATPVGQFREMLREMDGCLSNIASVFSDFEATKRYVREKRDGLAQRLAPWDALHSTWDQLSPRGADPFSIVPPLRDLYRFLAPRYMPVDEWTLLLSRGTEEEQRKPYGAVKTWYEREPSVA